MSIYTLPPRTIAPVVPHDESADHEHLVMRMGTASGFVRHAGHRAPYLLSLLKAAPQ